MTQYENCLETLLSEVAGRDVEDIPEDVMSRLRAAGGREEEGQNVFNCQVPGCSMEIRTQVVAGRILQMSSDVIAAEQPCTEN